ncbi:hypothetical protein MU0083_003614 [[Mycobacterium] kokjensenii]|uniref:Uncharacterized protein n=1 Tax=[Mycobacterium] kokjensenii TaxID=3064287 RepID=A0ABM9LUX8_9MYCO|nr:hypothetical protein [Mycolicibacter sp. MU0083]CAJ1505136.1 hypothetical protein MU0083_003614 [Mycolicibacter sp. MU0083]
MLVVRGALVVLVVWVSRGVPAVMGALVWGGCLPRVGPVVSVVMVVWGPPVMWVLLVAWVVLVRLVVLGVRVARGW